MKVTKAQLAKIIKEAIGEVDPPSGYHFPDDESALASGITHAQKTLRKDNMSYEDFVGVIVDKLDLYDYWVGNYTIDAAMEAIGHNPAVRYGRDWPKS